MGGPVDGAPPPSFGGPVERRRRHWWQVDHLADDEPEPVVEEPLVEEREERHDVVEYDLSDWNEEQLAELEEQLQIVSFPHEWRGRHLHVPGVVEQTVDSLIDAIDELDEVPDDVQYEFVNWTPQQCDRLVERLLELDVVCLWDGHLLSIGAADEATVDAEVLKIDPTFPVSGTDEEEPVEEESPKSGWGPIIGDIVDRITGSY